MKRVINALVMVMCVAGIAFAAEEAAVTTSTAKGTAESKAPVTKAAVEVTKKATNIVTSTMERRQGRREARRGILFGVGQKEEAATSAK